VLKGFWVRRRRWGRAGGGGLSRGTLLNKKSGSKQKLDRKMKDLQRAKNSRGGAIEDPPKKRFLNSGPARGKVL